MKLYFTILLSCFICSLSFADDDVTCLEGQISNGKLFELSIESSFSGGYEYKFCEGSNYSYLFSTYIEPMPNGLPSLKHTSKVKINTATKHIIKKKYINALTSNMKDTSHGMDGSTWCFKPKNGIKYSNFCIWSPESNTKERGLTGIYDLQVFIHSLSNLDK